jgi:putative spermidine/putrescine transport system substrate-binding protein
MSSNQSRLILGLLIPLLLAVYGSCSTQDRAGSKTLTVVSYGGGDYQKSHKEAFCLPFAEATGISVDSAAWNADYGKLKAMVESGRVSWDVVDVTAAEFARGQREGLFATLNLLPEDCEFLPGSITPEGVASVYWATVLAYSRKAFPSNPPKTWKDFWDVQGYPGGRALNDDPRGNLEFALLADGVPKEKLYPLDVDRAFKKLDAIKPYVRVWWSDSTQPVQLLLNDSVALSSAWNGRIFANADARDQIGYTWQGAAQELDYWIIPRGSLHQDTASLFILFSSLPGPLAQQTKIVGYGPANKAALRAVPEDIRPLLPTYPANWDTSFVVNSDWWAKNEEEMKTRWLTWKGK